MEDDTVTGALVIFPSALDDLVVTRVVEVGITVAVADAFVVADIGVPVVYVSSLDAVFLSAAIVDIVGTAVVDGFARVIMDEFAVIQKHEHVDAQACACCMEDDVMTGALVIFPSALDDLVVTRVVEVGSTVAVTDAFVVAEIGLPVVYVSSLDAVFLSATIVDIVGTAVVDAFACAIMDEFAAIQKHEHVDKQACACCM